MRKISVAMPIAFAMAATAWAHTGATGIVRERMDAMEQIGDAMKAMAAVLRGEALYDQAAMEQAAATVRHNAEAVLPHMFPEGSNEPPSEALDAIWQDRETFNRLMDEFAVSAVALEAAVATAEFMDAFQRGRRHLQRLPRPVPRRVACRWSQRVDSVQHDRRELARVVGLAGVSRPAVTEIAGRRGVGVAADGLDRGQTEARRDAPPGSPADRT